MSITRRRFLKTAVAASAAFPLSCSKPSPENPSKKSKKKVGIIGAGLAGLAAAIDLRAAGFDVRIFEARPRVGGRVHTMHGAFDDGLWADVGACWIPSSHEHLMRYLRVFDVPLQETRPADLSHLRYRYFFRGVFVEDQGVTLQGYDRTGQLVPPPLQLREDEKALGLAELRRKYVVEPALKLGNPRDPDYISRNIELDRLSLTEFMRRQGASAEAIAILRLGLYDDWGDGADQVSALCVLRDSALLPADNGAWNVVAGGTDHLPRSMARVFHSEITLNTAVRAVRVRDNQVTLSLESMGRADEYTCDFVLCTVPLKVIEDILFEPALPDDKVAAARALTATSIARTIVQTKTRFWQKAGRWGDAITDLDIQAIVEPSLRQPGTRGLLSTYTAAASARMFNTLSEDERHRRVMNSMQLIHPELPGEAEKFVSVLWDNDPYAKGAFAAYGVGTMKDHSGVLGRREGLVFFAGEHTSYCPGWMEGALISGERAAGEIRGV